jgi:hypothetical protein
LNSKVNGDVLFQKQTASSLNLEDKSRHCFSKSFSKAERKYFEKISRRHISLKASFDYLKDSSKQRNIVPCNDWW